MHVYTHVYLYICICVYFVYFLSGAGGNGSVWRLEARLSEVASKPGWIAGDMFCSQHVELRYAKIASSG